MSKNRIGLLSNITYYDSGYLDVSVLSFFNSSHLYPLCSFKNIAKSIHDVRWSYIEFFDDLLCISAGRNGAGLVPFDYFDNPIEMSNKDFLQSILYVNLDHNLNYYSINKIKKDSFQKDLAQVYLQNNQSEEEDEYDISIREIKDYLNPECYRDPNNSDIDRDNFNALSDGRFGNYDDFKDRGGNIDDFMDKFDD